MQIFKLHHAPGMKYLPLIARDFFFQKNSSLHDNPTSIPHFLPYKTKSAYQIFSAIPICKSVFKLNQRKSPAIDLSTDLQTNSFKVMILTNLFSKVHFGFRLSRNSQLGKGNLKYVLTLIFLFLVVKGFSTNYYVSSSGNDGNSGTSENSAWKSLAKVNSFTPKPGDQILFKRGDTFYGSITVKSSGTLGNPITFGAYGTGANPIITGFTTLTSWTDNGGGIYYATLDVPRLNIVTLNGNVVGMGRYPDSGYLSYESHNAKISITDNQLTGTPDWTGAEIGIRKYRWIIDRHVVTNHIGTTLTYNSLWDYGNNTHYTPMAGNGYFFQNHINCLDDLGDWSYDATAKRIYMYFGGSPSGYTVKAGSQESNAVVNRRSFITFNNITFEGSNIRSVDGNIGGCSDINFTNCDFRSLGGNGIRFINSDRISVSGVSFTDILNNGLSYGTNVNDATVDGCTFNHIGDILGASPSGDGTAMSIFIVGNNARITNNIVKNTGYNAISFNSNNSLIEYNFVYSFCSVKDDGAGIYTFSGSNKTIRNNIILNGIGAYAGCEGGYSNANPYGVAPGIYLDNGVDNHNATVSGNTIANGDYAGINIHNNGGNTITNNKVFNYGRQLNFTTMTTGTVNTITGNEFVCKKANQYAIYFNRNIDDNPGDYADFDNNYYSRAVINDGKLIGRTTVSNSKKPITYILDEWKTYSSEDVNSLGSPSSITSEDDLKFEYNATTSNKTITLSEPMIDVTGTKYSGTVTLLPYTSIILMPDPDPTSTPDTTKPTFTVFSIPESSTSLVVAISSFSASDNKTVTGHLITESSTAPLAGNAGWVSSAPTSYTFATEGTKALYAWAKDAAGNVSTSVSAQVVITLPDVTKPVVTAFTIPATSTSLVVTVSSFTATDNKSVTGFKITESATAPLAGDAGWNTGAPTSYTFATEGTKTPYAWAKDAAGNVSTSVSGQVVITLPDVTKPVVTAFTIPATASSLVVIVSSFTATDNKSVTGFKITESASAPLAGDANWTASAPTSYTFAAEGTKTLYAWAKDAVGNVSVSVSNQVVITLPDVAKPTITGFTIPATSTSLVVTVNSFTATDNKSVTGFKITESATAPLAGDAGWAATAPTSYTFAAEGTKTLCAWAKDAVGNVSTSVSNQVVITLPDVTKPVVTAFTIPATSTSLVVAVGSFTASDNKTVTGFILTESATAPIAGNAGWTTNAPASYTFATEGTKTLYAWAKDAAGNVSVSLNGQVVITLPDVAKPVVNAFTIPATSSSLVVSVSSFIATDNFGVTGFKLTESATAPLAGDAGWNTGAPTSYSFSSEGTKTLYAWAKDAVGNVSVSVSNQVVITLPDVTKPVVTAFTIPATSNSLAVAVGSFTASDNKTVTGFILTESATAPLAGDAGWNTGAPTSYSFSSEGTKTLYAWTKDAAGNVSTNVSGQVVITLPDVTKPTITAFTIPATSTSLVVTVSSFTATDNKSVTGFKITESATAPLAGDAGWNTGAPTSYTFAAEGTKTLYAWAKDATGNVSTSVSGQVVITLPDVTKPTITAFTIPATSTSLVVTVSSFTATENKAVTGFKITESATAPLAGDAGWNTGTPTSYTFAAEGAKTLYAWAKDAAGNVSTSVSAQVVITLPDVTKPAITAFTIPATASSLVVTVSSLTATDNKSVTGFILTESATAPLAGDAGWNTGAPTSYTFAAEGTKTLYAWAKDAAGNVSTSVSGQVVITLTDVTKPTITAFTIPANSTSLVVAVSSFNASDNKSVTGFILTESATAPLAGNAGWSAGAPISFTFAAEGTKTLYAWTKDAAGNVSTSVSKQVVITLPDVAKPTITAFTIPATSTSLVVAVSSFTATDNIAVTGFKLTENSAGPLAGDAGWTTGAPTSYTFATEGTKTLYAWTKDAAGNVSTSVSGQVVITLPDVTKPTITAFTIPATSASLNVIVSSFTATDNFSVTGFKLTESATAPLAGNAGWSAGAPTSYTFATEGTKTLFAWAKDAADNVSTSVSDQVVITLPDIAKPIITAFTIPATSSSLVFSVGSFTASDNKAVTGFILTESATAPLAGDAGWTTTAPASYTFATEGTKTLYAWTKDAAGNVSVSLNGQVVITLPDVTNPVVNAFTIPATSSSLVVFVGSFTASDNKAVTGFILTETATAPLAGNAGWSAGAPTSYTFATEGSKTLYAWAKDAAGNVSTSVSGQVVITLPDVTKPTITAFTIPTTSTLLVVTVSSFTATDNKSVTGFKITESATAPLAGDAGWLASAPISYSFDSEGTKTLYAWARDAVGNVSAGVSGQVVIILPIDNTEPDIVINEVPIQSIELRKGWNIFSTFLVPENENMEAVMQTLVAAGKLIRVDDEPGNTYLKQNNVTGWVNKIGNVEKTEGYKIRVVSDCTLEITGQPITLPLSIGIKKGTNIISFPINGSVDAMEVIQPLIDAGILDKVQDERGNSIEYWRNTGWKNGIVYFNGGEGYIIQALGSGVLTINETGNKSGFLYAERLETSHFKVDYEGNGIDHMNINILDLDKIGLETGDEIAAFDGGICVGAIKLSESDFTHNAISIPVSASAPNESVGFTEGNPIELKVWHINKSAVSQTQSEVVEGEMNYQKYASVFVKMNEQKTVGIDEFESIKIDMFPNPAREKVNLRFSTFPERGTKIMILDVTGKQLISRDAQSINETLNIQHLPAGIYFVKTQLNNNFSIQKLIKR